MISLIRPEGKALRGARVEVQPEDHMGRFQRELALYPPAVEYSPGRYRVEGLAPGMVGLTIRAEGFLPVERRVNVNAGEFSAKVQLRMELR